VAQNPAIITPTGREYPYGYMDWWPTSVCFNCDDGPYTAKELRWAVTHSINRQQILEVALGGSGIMSDLPFPYYPALMPYIEATQPLLEQYPTGEYNLEKAAALLEGQGYAKDGDGFWAKDGERLAASVGGWQVFTDVGPIIAEQLRQGGFEAEFVTPADFGTRVSEGTQKVWLAGIAASGVVDPFGTLERFSSKYYMPVGQPTQNAFRWVDPEFDAVLEEMSLSPVSDPGYMDLYLQAMEIWLDNLPTAPIQQWLHRIPYNTTYWTGWPTEENVSVNGAFWALTFGKYLHDLKATS
jgi:peptide/nickel transport system substrate-binding protein